MEEEKEEEEEEENEDEDLQCRRSTQWERSARMRGRTPLHADTQESTSPVKTLTGRPNAGGRVVSVDGGAEEEEEQQQENDDGDGDGCVGEASVEHPEVPDNTLLAALQPYARKIPPEDPNPSTRDATFIKYATEWRLTQLVIPVAPS